MTLRMTEREGNELVNSNGVIGRRRKWNKEQSYLLLQEVSTRGAHVAPHGKVNKSAVAGELNKNEVFYFQKRLETC